MKCVLCGKEISMKESNNAEPLAKGRCCHSCNWRVIKERLRLANKKAAEESVEPTLGELDGVAVGGGGPVNVTDPMADFERYAEEFEKTFILGKTPVHKEDPKNKTKVEDGKVVGSIDSMAKDEKVEQVDPLDENKNTKSATEGLSLGPNYQKIISSPKKDYLVEALLKWIPDEQLGQFLDTVKDEYEPNDDSNSIVKKLRGLIPGEITSSIDSRTKNEKSKYEIREDDTPIVRKLKELGSI